MDDEDLMERSYPWSWRASLVLAGDWLSNLLDESGQLVNGLASQLAADHNYRINRRKAHEQMARELETILEGDDG